MPFGDEPPTTPETWRAVVRRWRNGCARATRGDVAALQALRKAAPKSNEDTLRYMRACMEFVGEIALGLTLSINRPMIIHQL